MSNQNQYKHGVWNAICDVCGEKFKSDELRKRWDGLMVCGPDWEPRHPQDFLRAIKETSNKLPWSRPDDGGTATESPLYVEENYWTDYNATGLDMFYVRNQ